MGNAILQITENLSTYSVAIIVSLLSFIIILYKLVYTTSIAKNVLPSPRKLPILGNFHQLGTLPHRSLCSLSKRYGDLMLLHLGSKPTIVVSSSNGAEAIMKTHDIIFANRPKSQVAFLILYGGMDIAFGKYGEFWRNLKSICVLNMLSNKKVLSFRRIREEEVGLMVEDIKKSTTLAEVPISLSESLTRLTTGVVLRVTFGSRNYGGDDGCVDVGELVSEFSEALGAFSVGDFIPWLSWIDELRGVLPKARKVAKALDGFIQNRVEEHIDAYASQNHDNKGDKGEKIQDFVDVLLEIQRNDPSLQMNSLKVIIMDMLAGGIETSATLLEWIMSELLLYPRVMKRLQEEVGGFVKGKTMINEDDLKDMIYLKAVIKEGLRLHPPVPLLLFRESSQDTKLHDYDIAAGTQVIINAWAIQRNPAYWEEPEEFRPERFMNSSVDIKQGQDFEFIAFGAGRRGCPGMSFAMIKVELALANLVSQFNWKLPGEVHRKSFMAETFGTSVHKRDPLYVIPTPFSST